MKAVELKAVELAVSEKDCWRHIAWIRFFELLDKNREQPGDAQESCVNNRCR
jgi:hypothetical protein